jgi:uncharacterized protein
MFHWLFKSLIEKKFNLFISNEVLTEYEEIITEKLSIETANSVIRALMELENVHLTSIYFKFNLINQDLSDNKFVDCAFAGNYDFLVSNDKHFNILKTFEFPQINVVKLEEFQKILADHFNQY